MRSHVSRVLRVVVLSTTVFIASTQFSQDAGSISKEESSTFRSDVRVVIVDVVVQDNKDAPVEGLAREQFQLLEDGRLQKLTSFEEHSGLPDAPTLARMAKLPPNVFSNAPLIKTGDAANILLLDSLNTEMADQSYVHAEMVKFIREIRPGTRLAIFTLGSRLRFVQGFTGDAALLMAAADGKNSAGNPTLSPLLQTGAEKDANQRAIDQMSELQAATQANMQGRIDALRQFQAETTASQLDLRIKTTLEAMQQLGMYLEGIPGRKNVVWFAGSFPVSNLSSATSGNSAQSSGGLPDPGSILRQYDDSVVKTANILAAAQVAIYPISSQGVAVDRHYDFSNKQPQRAPGGAPGQAITQYQNEDLAGGSVERNASYAGMEVLARSTGGEAYHGANTLNEVLDHVIKVGTHYYTLTYSPTNRNMDGRLRKIQVNVEGGKYRLSYRRGYYATDSFLTSTSKQKPGSDPLRPLMDHGTPDSTEILFTVQITPAANQPGAGSDSQRAGDNPKLKGPLTRYAMTFTVSPEHLSLKTGTDGLRHGALEVTAVLYDRDGRPVNWMVRLLQVPVPPDRYGQVQANGIAFKVEIDAPESAAYLRSGLYDLEAGKAGTLEVPLTAVMARSHVVPSP